MKSDFLRAGFLLTSGLALALSPCHAANPFITSIYTADPSAHVWADGRLYVYPSRDIDPPKGCDLMDHYHVFSTDNLVDWRDEGEILNASQVEWGRKEGGFMWAPDAAYRNGKYYFYFPHSSDTKWNDSWKIGVAVSDKPASDFKSAGYLQGVGGFIWRDKVSISCGGYSCPPCARNKSIMSFIPSPCLLYSMAMPSGVPSLPLALTSA